MHITDTIADMLTRIRNASAAKHDTVDIPASNMKKEQRLRELEQEANWPDTDHQGFITLFASSLPELDVFDRDMQNKAKNWHMKLNPMKGQQRAALTTILPLGI